MLYWHRARVDPLVRAAQQPGKPTPWVEITWPRWQIRAAKGYAVLLACMFALLLVVLLITAFTERF